MGKKVIGIGAGIAGLTAGIYARKYGYETLVLERSSRCGGVQGGWDRGGYHFEGSLHWLIGCKPTKLPITELYSETAILSDNNPQHFGDPVYGYSDGETSRDASGLGLWRDINVLEKELLEAAPDDHRAIKRLVSDIRHPFVPHRLLRLLFTSTGEYLSHFKDPRLKCLLSNIVHPDHNAFAFIYVLYKFATYDACYTEGGSSRIIDNMQKRYAELGGELTLNCEAKEIVLRDGKVCGVRTADGFAGADAVVVASDTLKAVDKLFAEPLKTPWAEKLRRTTVSEQCVLICLGVRADLSHRPEAIQCRLRRPVSIAGELLDTLTVYNYAFCKDYAPEGCTAITVLAHSQSHDWWHSAKADGRYEAEKLRTIKDVTTALEEVLPEIKGKVEVTDMTTPLTYERYCDTHQGGWMSIWPKGTPPRILPAKGPCKGLYFAGERTMICGGIPIAVQSALRAVSAIKKDL